MVAGSNVTFQPVGAVAASAIYPRRGAGIGDDDRDRTLLRRHRTRAQQSIASGDLKLRLSDDIKRKLGLRRSILGFDRHLYREIPASIVPGGRTLSLMSLD